MASSGSSKVQADHGQRRSSSMRPKTAPESNIAKVLYRSGKKDSSDNADIDQEDGRSQANMSKTDRLISQYERPWVPRSATLGEVTLTANKQGAPIHQAIMRARERPRTHHAGMRPTTLPRLNDAAVKEIEAAFDRTMVRLQETLAQERKPMDLMFANSTTSATDHLLTPKDNSKRRGKMKSAPVKKGKRAIRRESRDNEREIDESRMPAGKRLEQKLNDLRQNEDSALQLHRSVAAMKGESAKNRNPNQKYTNFHRINRLTIKVMESAPIPGGDPCSHDYEIRNRSPPKTARRHLKHTNHKLERALTQKNLPKWQEQVAPHVSMGGAPYPRTVFMANIEHRRSTRQAHREEVLTRKNKIYRETQSARAELATRHERRVEESARARIVAAETAERQFRQQNLLRIASISCAFKRIGDHILAKRLEREETDKAHRASLLIAKWWGVYQFKKRQITDVGFLMRLSSMMKPWVMKARQVVRKRHANIMLYLIRKVLDSNQVTVAMKTFRERVLTIQRYWKAAIKGRKAKLNVLYLQWMRYETNLIKERRRQDAEYEARLKREVAMLHPAKRRAATKKLDSRDESPKAQGVVKEKSEDIVDNDGIGLALRDEDIHAAMAVVRNKSQGMVMPEVEEEEEEVEEEKVEYTKSRKIKTDVPGEDGLHMNYAMLKKLGIKALKHGMSPAEADKKKQQEEEEDFKNRRVPRDIKIVINQIIYQRSKLKYFRDLAKYEEDMVTYINNAPFEEVRLELFAKAGLKAERKLFKPMKPHVKIILDRSTLAFMHSKGVRMMQVREAEERQRKAEMEAMMEEGGE